MVVWSSNVPAQLVGRGLKWLWSKNKSITVIVVVAVGVVHTHNYRKKQARRKKWDSTEKDVVVLHSFPRGRFCPNLSPFVVKLETYLRMADIKYEMDFEEPMGPKGKCPWITLNGKDIADSQLIMEELGEKYGKNFSSHLTQEQKAVSRAFLIMVDEHLYWGLIVWRYLVDMGRTLIEDIPLPLVYRLMLPLWLKKIQQSAWMQGIARHENYEVEGIMKKDLKAISDYLADKQFLFGEEPCEVDCAVFGMLSQIEWNSRGSPYVRMLDLEFQNLHSYCQRMKERFWPDWNQCLNPPVLDAVPSVAEELPA